MLLDLEVAISRFEAERTGLDHARKALANARKLQRAHDAEGRTGPARRAPGERDE